MNITEKLQKIDQLKMQIDAFGKLSPEVLKKINYKFRLDWNYYSNRMEGGTLTREETRSVMVGNIDVKGKPIKDVLEMNGHDKMVLEILKMGKGELRIAEKRIREIHRAIMHEEDASKQGWVGNWKVIPNEIINYKNEKISFTSPGDVADAIHQLLNETNAELDAYFKNRPSMHPLQIASRFHIGYVTIHPFYDGNGRTARILTNLLLVSCGFPPIIIKDEHKQSYYQLLADIQAYGGSADLFESFLGDRLMESQQLLLDAIAGKDINEPTDLDKRLALLEKELEAVDPENEIKKEFSKEVVLEIYDSWFSDLMKGVIPAVQKFNKFFTGSQHWINVQHGVGSIQFVNEPADEILANLRRQFQTENERLSSHDFKIVFQTAYGSFKKGGINSFGCNYGLEIKIEQTKYELTVDKFVEPNVKEHLKIGPRLLHKPITDLEMNAVIKTLATTILDHIDYHTKKNGLR